MRLTRIASELIADIGAMPPPASPAAAELAFERWEEAAAEAPPETARRARALAADPAARSVLASMFGNSPFLTQCAIRDIAFACDLLAEGVQAAWDRTMTALDCIGPHDAGTEEIMSALRIAKRRTSLATAVADLGGVWPVEVVCARLSDFAQRALTIAADHLLAGAAAAGDIVLPAPDDPSLASGWIVLGMGKLGGRELNYSSDIDLIVLYDGALIEYTGRTSLQQCMIRLTQSLVKVMAERTSDGYVFRTDLRLRPDPGSTPVAVATRAAEIYYESAGQNWERAAMIKARPVAGDIVAGEAFLEMLRPFIWRKSLDFFAIQDIHSIKRQINAQRGGSTMEVAGHDIKLGRGGIREIEFFAQTQQLIWGGRDPSLRLRATCDALRALAGTGLLESIVSSRLIRAYRFHRRLENRLQMVDDQQTHSLPEDEAELRRIALMMGYADRPGFEAALLEELRAVESHYAVLFEKTPDLSGPGNLVFTGADDDPETLETLARLGFREPSRVAERIRVWHHGRYNSTRSARARELLTELVPTVLETLSTTNDPDAALLRFDDFLRTLPAGVHVLSLFTNNPALLGLLAKIMGSAPRLADWLSRHPIMLEGVLQPASLDFNAGSDRLTADLEGALGEVYYYEEKLDICRYWNNAHVFEIGVQMLDGRIDGADAGRPLADLATSCVRALLPATAREFAREHGAVPDSAFAVLGFGKLGGRELTTESDLDLLFLYETGDEHAESDGSRPLPCQTYYARLCQRFIGAMSAPTNEGKLYEVDMRLRPAGASGPIATSLAAFTRYQNGDAWTWEHLALTRARVIAAPAAFAARIERTIASVLTRERDPDRLVCAVADMRERMEGELAVDDFWSIKRFRGGMIDIEFIAQYLQLRHAGRHPDVLSTNTTDALERLAGAGCLEPSVADELIEAMTLWRRLQGIVRLAFGAGVAGRRESPALQEFVARALGAADYAALEKTSLAFAARSRRHFEDIVARPAAALMAASDTATGKDRR